MLRQINTKFPTYFSRYQTSSLLDRPVNRPITCVSHATYVANRYNNSLRLSTCVPVSNLSEQ